MSTQSRCQRVFRRPRPSKSITVLPISIGYRRGRLVPPTSAGRPGSAAPMLGPSSARNAFPAPQHAIGQLIPSGVQSCEIVAWYRCSRSGDTSFRVHRSTLGTTVISPSAIMLPERQREIRLTFFQAHRFYANCDDSFISQRFDGIEVRRAIRGIQTEADADCGTDKKSSDRPAIRKDDVHL